MISAVNPDMPAPTKKTPQKKRKRPINEPSITPPIRRKRTKSNAVAEAARKRWETLEAQVEFPILVPRPMDAPQRSVKE